jgi:hypothetical protein
MISLLSRKFRNILRKFALRKNHISKEVELESLKELKEEVNGKIEELTLEEKAFTLLKANTREAKKDGKKFIFTMPSEKTYPFQWFWDSCFHAIAWTHFDPERAKEELRSLLAWQYKDGFIPHVIFWDKKRVRRVITSWHMKESKGRLKSFLPFFGKPNTTHEIQPPTLAKAVLRIFETDKDKDFLKEVAPGLNKYYRWLFEYRDTDNDGLISIISSLESGLDFSPAYDPMVGVNKKTGSRWIRRKFYRATWVNKFVYNYDSKKILNKGPFNVEDTLVNSIFAVNLDALACINKEIGNGEEEKEFRQQSRRVSRALINKCWDPEKKLFFNLCRKNEEKFKIASIQAIFPIIIPWLPKEIADDIVTHIKDEEEFWLDFPLPSVAKKEYSFSEKSKIDKSIFIWRGTSWININWYIAAGLRLHGYPELAKKLTDSTRRMVGQSGFREHYNPRTGEGYGAENFGWSTLVIDMLK